MGRLIKLEGEEYLETVSEIMKLCPETVYVVCGVGGQDNINAKLDSLGLKDRFYFEGWVEPKIYNHITDVYLNTFPDPSGEALNEYFKLNKGQGIVSINKTDLVSDHKHLHLKQYIYDAHEEVETVKLRGRDFLRALYTTQITEDNRIIAKINDESEETKQIKKKQSIY